MDVLESGRDERRGPRSAVWIGILVAAVVAVVGWNQLQQRRPQHRVAAVASPSPSPSPKPPAASLVWLTDSYNFNTDDDGSFVLDFDLHNFNTAPIQVEAGVVRDPSGIDKLAMSLLPAPLDEVDPGEGRSTKQIRMEARSFATLRLTGRVDCKTFRPSDTPLPIRVNGEPATLTFPPVDTDHYWPQIIHEVNCPS